MLLLLTPSCGGNKQEEKKDKEGGVESLPPDRVPEVKVVTLQTKDFEHELVSNGKITARKVAELRFRTAEIIDAIYVRNGARVSEGQKIAQLDTYALQNKLNQAKANLERSNLEMQDVLIGHGYKLDSLAGVPEETRALAQVKSGYNTAQTQYDLAKYDLEGATLVAPFSGVVANLFAKPHTLSTPSEPFCHIIDASSLEVEFTVLENEVGLLHLGDPVEVTPFAISDLEVSGKVTEINPWIDENGMVKVKASVNYHPRLVEGMNVRVSAFRSAGKQWVVPKSAVVMRTGKQVLFTEVDGKAMWNYVQTGLENATEYTVTSETLKEGDRVIVSGNINLAHEAPVKVISSDTTKAKLQSQQ